MTTRTASALVPVSLSERYAQELAAHGYVPDAAQRHALERLELLRTRLVCEDTGGLWQRLLRRLQRRRHSGRDTHGLYLWGGVGRGKTWLMDLFYESLPLRARRRVHFHHFMRDVHRSLSQIRAQRNPLELVARRIASRIRVLCLDEMHVNDIADAMILGALLEALLRYGVMLVMTSNLPPQDLYHDGLQRSRFLPAIALLQRELEILPVDGGIDYRLRHLQHRPIYLDSAAAATAAQLQQLFDTLAGEHGESSNEIVLQGRKLRAVRRRGDVVWFSFAALCEGPRSQNDYADIAEAFRSVVVSDIPLFTAPQQDNAARRFIWLIDEFYDQGIKLIVSAAAGPTQLYRTERLQFEFQRTASRLIEMQSDAYLARPHRG